jgi:type IV pilus assembly protein PilA
MIHKLRQRMAKEESGFTLVELLVVMLILALLAAIAIPSFFNQRDKARDADAKESVRTAQTAIETYAIDNNGEYTGALAGDLEAIEQTLTDAPNTVEVTGVAPKAYTLTVESATGNRFWITRASGGTTTLQCSVADADNRGGCPTNGFWD